MKPRDLFVLAVLFTAPAGLIAGPSVRLLTPPPGQYHVEQLWQAAVTSDSAYNNVWFEGAVFESQRGRVFWARTRPFALTRGSRVYRYGDVAVEQTQTAPGYEAFVTRTGQLPSGSYRFQLTLMPAGVGDSSGFEPRPTEPPRLLAPAPGDTVRIPHPQFVWTRPAQPHPAGLTYGLRVAEVLPGQSPQEALESGHPWFEVANLTATTFRYPLSARDLEPRRGFAWQITASAAGAAVGTSEAWGFVFATPGRGESEEWQKLLERLSKLLPGVWKTIAKLGIKIAGATGRYIADQAWAATVNQWQALTQDRPGELITPAPNTWPNVRIVGLEQGGRSYLIVIVLGPDGNAKDVYVLPCPFSTGFGEFGLTVGGHEEGILFPDWISEYTITNNDLIPITDVIYEFDQEPEDWDDPSGWDSENPGGDEKKVRFYADGNGILPGQAVKFEIERGDAKLKSITASYKAADGSEKLGYRREY